MAGYDVTKQTLNDRLGGLAVQLRDVLDAVNREAALVAGFSVAQLQGLGFSGDASSGDVQVLQAFGAEGQNLHSTIYTQNLIFWTLKLVGIN